ncbi:hypothetical protein H4S04_007984 [Coemansia sp. S16]|nr:hypothetical protein LPJ71_002512 [Coemansia sp. S17]KAJ2019521.1 hypothetical protein GGI14_001537 [Coemansia sp. S680]KAJ2040067.1 hypothetical protein H4S04_007984 [Coemansia sp. S16]KAJ2044158.1 hypothetical protein GGI08_007184 [Coemansia sp. S2]KAJ2094903.1 hypothetical protein GGI09_005153 [Coemansia sp. S100]KAJ2099416.1 hypothetical protein GGI16_004004 [Coemansia sp. S142-1]
MLLNRYDRLVFLGDSNADNGNVFAMTKQTRPLPRHVYMDGRYSNGKMWVDHLNDFATTSETIMLAYGCATIDNDIVAGTVPMPDGTRNEVPSLTEQVACLHTQFGKLRSDDLVFVFVGSNDLNSLIDRGPTYITKQTFTPEILATRLRNAVRELCQRGGARNVILMNIRPREDYPSVLALNSPKTTLLTRQVTAALNMAIGKEIAELQMELGGEYMVDIFDTYSFQKRITQDPAAFGIDPDVQTPSYNVTAVQGQRATDLVNPDSSLFLDGAHMAKRAHALLAAEVIRHIALSLATR